MNLMLILMLIESCLCLPQNSSGKVVGGYPASNKQFPFQIAIYLFGNFQCGGTIISKKFVLTAAHCIYLKSTFSLKIYAGIVVNTNTAKDQYEVESIIVHEKYIPQKYNNDIGLLKIRGSFKLKSTVKIAKLPTSKVKLGRPLTVIGWGETQETQIQNLVNGRPNILKFITASVDDPNKLKQHLESTEGVLSLKRAEKTGICFGDSGSPALNKDIVVGVASFAIKKCASSTDDGFTEVFYYLPWIKKKMGGKILEDNNDDEVQMPAGKILKSIKTNELCTV